MLDGYLQIHQTETYQIYKIIFNQSSITLRIFDIILLYNTIVLFVFRTLEAPIYKQKHIISAHW